MNDDEDWQILASGGNHDDFIAGMDYYSEDHKPALFVPNGSVWHGPFHFWQCCYMAKISSISTRLRRETKANKGGRTDAKMCK